MGDDTGTTVTAKPTDHQHATAEDFIATWPLYTACKIDEGFIVPRRISYDCDNPPRCEKETTWALTEDPTYKELGKDIGSAYIAQYVCVNCGERYLTVMYREVEAETRTRPRVASSISRASLAGARNNTERIVTKVQKIGQYPPLSIQIAKPLEKNLGKDQAAVYKRAIICRNEGYGLAAVSYIRRVIEDKTEELIEVVAQMAEVHGIEPSVVAQVRATKDEKTTYDKKLKIASTIIPQSLLIDGVNPLDVLYGLVSAGLHDLSEEECIAIADETQSAFEFTFTRLRAEIEARKDFTDKIKKWAGGNSPAFRTPKS